MVVAEVEEVTKAGAVVLPLGEPEKDRTKSKVEE